MLQIKRFYVTYNMHEVYEKSVLTPKKVALESGFIDWEREPTLFKSYPHFSFRYSFKQFPDFSWLHLTRFVSQTLGDKDRPYRRLNTPSAGNLHPIEMYVQVRGCKGVLSGIYHVDILNEELVLIEEVAKKGLEKHLGLENTYNGVIVLFSIVPFRSVWKYGYRAVRYCYMDLGHQIGAMQVALQTQKQSATILSDFDVKALNEIMGFRGEEFVASVALLGSANNKESHPLKEPLISVQPCDYIQNYTIEKTLFEEVIALESNHIVEVNATEIAQRRSARAFAPQMMTSMQYEGLEPFLHSNEHTSYVVVMNAMFEEGIYKNGECQHQSVERDKVVSILVDQRFIAKANMVIVLTHADYTNTAVAEAGRALHMVAMRAQQLGLGYSSIGAFYDAKLQALLGTDEKILLVGVVGQARSEDDQRR